MIELIILATVLVSLFSLVGIVFFSFNEKLLKSSLVYLVAFAVGGMLGGAFFHLLPEALDKLDAMQAFTFVLIGFGIFFITEKFLHWRHCHEEGCDVHGCCEKQISGKHKKGKIRPAAYLNLVGDFIHNLMDGIVIATAFMTNIHVGIATTIAIIVHEIPQELGDFGVLVHSGLDKKKALAYNLLSALAAVVGGVATYYFLSNVTSLVSYLLPIAAGGFIYIATVDLVPELHKERKASTSILQLLVIVAGIVVMYYLKAIVGG
jgi:zinc and cadmium transporter